MALPKISRGVGPQVTLFFELHGMVVRNPRQQPSLSEPVSAPLPPRRLSAYLREQRRPGKASKPERLIEWSSQGEPPRKTSVLEGH